MAHRPTAAWLTASRNSGSPPSGTPALKNRDIQFETRFGLGLPERIRVDLDAGYDSHVTRETLTWKNCDWKISPKGTYIEINHTRRWMIERTNSWHTRGFGILQIVLDRKAPVQDA